MRIHKRKRERIRTEFLDPWLLTFRHTPEESRAQGIVRHVENGGSVPPIEVYENLYGFYLSDGHHRVEAFRRLGKDIEAEISPFP